MAPRPAGYYGTQCPRRAQNRPPDSPITLVAGKWNARTPRTPRLWSASPPTKRRATKKARSRASRIPAAGFPGAPCKSTSAADPGRFRSGSSSAGSDARRGRSVTGAEVRRIASSLHERNGAGFARRTWRSSTASIEGDPPPDERIPPGALRRCHDAFSRSGIRRRSATTSCRSRNSALVADEIRREQFPRSIIRSPEPVPRRRIFKKFILRPTSRRSASGKPRGLAESPDVSHGPRDSSKRAVNRWRSSCRCGAGPRGRFVRARWPADSTTPTPGHGRDFSASNGLVVSLEALRSSGRGYPHLTAVLDSRPPTDGNGTASLAATRPVDARPLHPRKRLLP